MLLIFVVSSVGGPAWATDFDQKKEDCEHVLSSASPGIYFEPVVDIAEKNAVALAWEGPWLNVTDPKAKVIRGYQPLTSIIPSRVRIMPVGSSLQPHRTRAGESFQAVVGSEQIKILTGADEKHLRSTIPFATWDGLVPRWALDENSESVLIAVDRDSKLQVIYPFSPDKTPLEFPVQEGTSNPQVSRDVDGRLLILIADQEGGAEIFTLKEDFLAPLAIFPEGRPRLFMGLGDRPWMGWGEDEIRVALFDGLTTPVFTLSLESGEKVLDFSYQRESADRGLLAVLTSERIRIFSVSTKKE